MWEDMPPEFKQERNRISLDVPKETRDRIVAIRKMTSAPSLTAVVRQSLRLYESLLNVQQEGAIIIARLPSGKEKQLLAL